MYVFCGKRFMATRLSIMWILTMNKWQLGKEKKKYKCDVHRHKKVEISASK
jgi:hypothetical protein